MFGLLFLLSIFVSIKEQKIYVFSRNKRMKEMYSEKRATNNKKKRKRGKGNNTEQRAKLKTKKKLFQ